MLMVHKDCLDPYLMEPEDVAGPADVVTILRC